MNRHDIKQLKGTIAGSDQQQVQAVLFSTEYWNIEEARMWLSANEYKSGRIDVDEDWLRFDQAPESDFENTHETSIDFAADLHNLKGVEIFRAGTWNGRKFTTKDLDDIVSNFNKVGFRPPIKLGHAESSGDRAYGWVEKVYRKGDTLLADFMDLPSKVFEAIEERGYDNISSEIFRNLKYGGKVFSTALKAVALLGAEMPGVAFLKPLRENFTQYDQVVTYVKNEDDEMTPEQIAELQAKADQADGFAAKIAELEAQLGEGDDKTELTTLKNQLVASQTEIAELKETNRQAAITAKVDACNVPAYRELLRHCYNMAGKTEVVEFTVGDDKVDGEGVIDALVSKINKDAEGIFKHESKHEEGDEGEKAEVRLEAKILEFRQQNKEAGYTEAYNAVLAADPELKKELAGL